MGVIASEFACYDFEQLAGFSTSHIEVLFKEATRQRAAKYSLLAMLINKSNQPDDTQRDINRHIDNLLNPYKIRAEVTGDGWAELRAKRGK